MKIRYGHVTNSSSTSYIIVIDRQTEDTYNSFDDLLPHLYIEDEDEEGREVVFERKYGIKEEVVKKMFEKGWGFLSCSASGMGAYNDGDFQHLLKQGGVKMLAEFYSSSDYNHWSELWRHEDYQEFIDNPD